MTYHFNGVVVDELVSSCYDNLWGQGVLHGDAQPLLDVFTDRHTPVVTLIHLLQHWNDKKNIVSICICMYMYYNMEQLLNKTLSHSLRKILKALLTL